MIIIFDENYKRNYFFDINQSMFDFDRDDQDYSQKYLNDELFSFDQSIEIKNQKMIDLWNDGKVMVIQIKFKKKLQRLKQTIKKIRNAIIFH